MFTPVKHASALSAAMLFCTTVAAQTAGRPDPLNANAIVPALTYQSSFANDRRAGQETKPLSWREANDAAARIGGWRVYAREAQTPDPALAAPALPAVPAAPAVIAPPAPAAPAAPAASSSMPSNAHQHHKP
jgi:hypothetical protein